MRRFGFILLGLAGFCALAPNFMTAADEIKSPRVTRIVTPSHDSGFTDMQCMSCHQMPGGFSHPVNIVVRPGMAPELPLQNGKVVCTTCHESGIDDHRLARANGDPLLRIENSLVLCSQCHDSSHNTRASQHALALGRAHLTNTVKSKAGGLIRETQNCLTCHDGLISQDVAMSVSSSRDAMSEHPVNVTYRSRLETAAEVRVKPAGSLNPAIRLFDGKIGCGSCHSPYSTQESLLVMSNTRSALCFGCHNQ
jgi:predicted CXXCH cytochrome family protein